jgi:hypothetical protein
VTRKRAVATNMRAVIQLRSNTSRRKRAVPAMRVQRAAGRSGGGFPAVSTRRKSAQRVGMMVRATSSDDERVMIRVFGR